MLKINDPKHKSHYLSVTNLTTMNSPKRKAQISKQNRLAKERRLVQPLTKIEVEIIKLICKEKTSSEIAVILEKSKRTIENHRYYIIKKIGCVNTVGVFRYALKNKIVKL